MTMAAPDLGKLFDPASIAVIGASNNLDKLAGQTLWTMLRHGVEMRVPDTIKKPDELFTRGTPDVFGTEGDLVVHPPVGKWVIAVGEQLFGQTSSWGWRFSVCLIGTLSILMIGRAARRLFGSSLLGTIAAFLVAFEGHHFVQSRTGLLDIIVMFWALAAFCALLIDRDVEG